MLFQFHDSLLQDTTFLLFHNFKPCYKNCSAAAKDFPFAGERPAELTDCGELHSPEPTLTSRGRSAEPPERCVAQRSRPAPPGPGWTSWTEQRGTCVLHGTPSSVKAQTSPVSKKTSQSFCDYTAVRAKGRGKKQTAKLQRKKKKNKMQTAKQQSQNPSSQKSTDTIQEGMAELRTSFLKCQN